MSEISVRDEEERDHEAVWRVHAMAFGRSEEADLVKRLRRYEKPLISLVAEIENRVVGHILFSPVRVGDFEAMALGPMAIEPGRQGQGIGSALVAEGFERCRHKGVSAVFVLGHPRYYPRFGFAPAEPRGLYFRAPGIGDAFMVIELTPGALDGVEGEVRYSHHFDDL